MADSVSVRVTDGDVWVDGEHLTRGDEVSIPAGVYERIPGSFERLDDGDDEPVEEDTEAVDDEDKDVADAVEATEDSVAEGEVPVEVPDELADDVRGAEGPIPFDPSAFSIPELEEELATVDDPAAVFAVATIEYEGGGRKGAYDVIRSRLDEFVDERSEE